MKLILTARSDIEWSIERDKIEDAIGDAHDELVRIARSVDSPELAKAVDYLRHKLQPWIELPEVNP